MIKLNNYLRQYRHNDNSDFVLGYEREGTEAFVSCLEQEIAELKEWQRKAFECYPNIDIDIEGK